VSQWDWLEKSTPKTWRFLLRVIMKASLLFIIFNLLLIATMPADMLGRMSIYNTIVPGRLRLPYGENPPQSYNVTLNNIPAMFASHIITQPKANDEFRVFLFGDSATWGWFLENDETLAAVINEGDYQIDGRGIIAYNLGYPIMSLTKDLLILDEAMRFEPDMVIWLVTLASFPHEKQIFPPIVHNNPNHTKELIINYDLNLDLNDERLIDLSFWQRSIFGQRRALADWLRLQSYGISWAATGIDQFIPDEIHLRRSDFEEDYSWESFDEPVELTRDDLTFDVLNAGAKRAGQVPLLVINEPMFISDGENSDIRYNSLYPRWAYNDYRELLGGEAVMNNWHYLDLWDSIAPEEFTDSPVHLTPRGTQQLAQLIAEVIVEVMVG